MFVLNLKTLLLAWATLVWALELQAAGPGESVVVVYNRRVPESKAIAEYYASQRQVPAKQIFGFNLTTNEEMSRAEFRDSLQRPLAKALTDAKLWRTGSRIVPATTNHPAAVHWGVVESKIRYAVLCYGVPLKIAPDPNLKEKGSENLRPEVRRNEAAVESDLALLPQLEDNPPLNGPLPNPWYGATNAALLHPTNGLLLVTRLDGPSPELARGLVDKALEAETNGLWGRAYFDLRNLTDSPYKLGDEWIRHASEVARRMGFETVVDEKPDLFPVAFPMSHIAFYAGWYTENVSGPFTRPQVEFMPGAFAYHLHSYSAGSIRTTNRFWVGPFLAKGVTCTMGSVNEPYLNGTPDVGTFSLRFMFSGFTFAEAAYAGSATLSWQTTMVGDPLYRPFGRPPSELLVDLERRQSPLLEWANLRIANFNLVTGQPLAQCIAALEQLPLTKHSAVLSEKLGDLYTVQGKPSSAAQAYAEALRLAPSPQQSVRLRLTLAEKLIGLGREAEAYTDYQQLLTECPDYPDKLDLYRKLVPLARKLHHSADLEKYEAEIMRLNAPAAPAHPKT
jgi:uncharacterized protein (TIGR03790 family)